MFPVSDKKTTTKITVSKMFTAELRFADNCLLKSFNKNLNRIIYN